MKVTITIHTRPIEIEAANGKREKRADWCYRLDCDKVPDRHPCARSARSEQAHIAPFTALRCALEQLRSEGHDIRVVTNDATLLKVAKHNRLGGAHALLLKKQRSVEWIDETSVAKATSVSSPKAESTPAPQAVSAPAAVAEAAPAPQAAAKAAKPRKKRMTKKMLAAMQLQAATAAHAAMLPLRCMVSGMHLKP